MDETKIQKSVLMESCAMNNHVVGDQFPAGLKILLVEDDRTCLLILETMLRKLFYEVTKCRRARDALALLREDKNKFDIVICDLHMPDMDGFKLLHIIKLEMDLPVVMISSDDRKGIVMKGIMNGVCDYLVKPIRMESVRLIWQHVVRKKKGAMGMGQFSQDYVNIDDKSLPLEQENNAANEMLGRHEENQPSLKRTKEDEDEDNDNDRDSSDEGATAKKPRMIWTQELHDIFVAAVNQLGRDKAVPKKILERMQAMNVTGLTRANIASHLQKYRMHLQKECQDFAENRHFKSFMEQASSYGRHNLHFQRTISTSSQLPLQSLITAQSYERSANEHRIRRVSSHEQVSNIFDSNISEASCYLPSELSSHDLSRTNLLYRNDYPAVGVAISNEEYLYSNMEKNVTDLSYPLSAPVDDLMYDYEPMLGKYDQNDFRGLH